jgi:hypothetical protein
VGVLVVEEVPELQAIMVDLVVAPAVQVLSPLD